MAITLKYDAPSVPHNYEQSRRTLQRELRTRPPVKEAALHGPTIAGSLRRIVPVQGYTL